MKTMHLMFKQKSANFLGSSFGLPPINVNEFKSAESQVKEPTKVFDIPLKWSIIVNGG